MIVLPLHYDRTYLSVREGSSVHPQGDLDSKENDATKRAIVELCHRPYGCAQSSPIQIRRTL